MPRMRARPPLGRRNPSNVRISVDLPAPLGPSNPIALPVPDAPRRQEIPCRISRRPRRTFRFSSSTTGVVFTASLLDRAGLQRSTQVLEKHYVEDQTW